MKEKERVGQVEQKVEEKVSNGPDLDVGSVLV